MQTLWPCHLPLFALTAGVLLVGDFVALIFLDLSFSSVGGLVVSLHDCRKCHPTGLIFLKEICFQDYCSSTAKYLVLPRLSVFVWK